MQKRSQSSSDNPPPLSQWKACVLRNRIVLVHGSECEDSRHISLATGILATELIKGRKGKTNCTEFFGSLQAHCGVDTHDNNRK